MRRLKLFQTTAFRWTLGSAAIVALSIAAMGGFLYWQTVGYFRTRIDSGLALEADSPRGREPPHPDAAARQEPCGRSAAQQGLWAVRRRRQPARGRCGGAADAAAARGPAGRHHGRLDPARAAGSGARARHRAGAPRRLDLVPRTGRGRSAGFRRTGDPGHGARDRPGSRSGACGRGAREPRHAAAARGGAARLRAHHGGAGRAAPAGEPTPRRVRPAVRTREPHARRDRAVCSTRCGALATPSRTTSARR